MRKRSKRQIAVETDYGQHRCVIEPDEKRGWIVTAPDLPGVITWGRNIAHARKMAREAIELCIECRVRERISPKAVRSLSQRLKATVA